MGPSCLYHTLRLTAAFLTFTLGVLAFRVKRRRGYGPFFLGVVGSALVLIGKFQLQVNIMMYGRWVIREAYVHRHVLIPHLRFDNRTGEAQLPQCFPHGFNRGREVWASLNVEDFDFH